MSSLTIAKYLRISSEDDDLKQSGKLESNSIANQRHLLQDFICRSPELAGANIVEFYDDGFSGKNFDRPAVKELFEQVKQGKIQCIIVKDLSRFGRDYLAVGNYISRVFPFIGVRFIAVNDGFDSNRPMDINSLDTSFKTLLYDIYSRDLSRKVRGALRFKAERGDFIAPFAPFGYIKNAKDRNHLVIDSEAAKTVERIFKMVLDGKTTLQIAKILNSECVPTPMCYKRAAGCPRVDWKSVNEDNFWTHTTVTKILHDERYIGKNVYGKNVRKAVGDFHCIKMKKADWIVVDDMHDGIVSREEFERANACLREGAQRNYTTERIWQEKHKRRRQDTRVILKTLNNRFVDAFTKYAEVEELTTEIVEYALQEVVIYPDRTLNIVWNYHEDLQKLMLSAGVSEISVK